MLLFSLSNGYVSTLAMMYAPECVAMHQKEQAGTLMVFCLTIGLTAGVFSGLGIKSLVDHAF